MSEIHNTIRCGIVTRQLIRYAIVGGTSNTVGYLVYLLVTYLGVQPKIAMSLLYVVGATVGFIGNSRLTFSYKGGVMASGLRYLMVHSLGYLINLSILVVFVDVFHWPHQMVQATAVFIVAAFLFIAFKFFVFRKMKVRITGGKI